MMRWSTGTVNDEFLHNYTRMINIVHDAVHDVIENSIVKSGQGVFLQTQLAENFAVKDDKVTHSQRRSPMERWYMEKIPEFSTQGDKIHHMDRVYLRSEADGEPKYLGVNRSGEMYMGSDKGVMQAFIITKELLSLSPEKQGEFDTEVHDTDGIYLASKFGQHHVGNQEDYPYSERIGVDEAGNFVTQVAQDKVTLMTVQTAREGDSYGTKPVWTPCPKCNNGRVGIFGRYTGFGLLNWDCKTCKGKGGHFEYVDITDQ